MASNGHAEKGILHGRAFAFLGPAKERFMPDLAGLLHYREAKVDHDTEVRPTHARRSSGPAQVRPLYPLRPD